MYRLRCFGRLAIEGEQDEVVELRPRKPRGLLLYLAAHPGRRHGRERIARLFWETEAERARHSLSQALYDLRRHLPGLELDRTQQEVGLPPGGIVYDGVEFEEAIRDDRLRDAAELYDGPFAPDLEAIGSPDFARWVERERTRYRGLAEKTLLRWVDECAEAGRWGEMVAAGGRLVSMNPLSEKAHRAVMRGLWLQGDRRGALAHFEEHEEHLRGESSGDLAPQTRTLIEEIRTSDRPARTGSDRPAPRAEMVGRKREFGLLKQALADVMDGESRFVLVEGEAGIGKSRLLEEFADVTSLEGVRVIESQCLAAESGVPYGPIADGLGDLAREVGGTSGGGDTTYHQLGHVLPDAFPAPEREEIYTQAEARRRRLAEEFVAFIRQASSLGPVVWLLDDAQWMDEASRSLVDYLASRLEDHPFLLVVSQRPRREEDGEAGPRRAFDQDRWTRVDLSHLSTEEIGDLLASLDRVEENDEQAIRRLHSLSGGNPLLALELIRRGEELPEELLAGEASGSGGGIPADVEKLVGSQIRTFSPEEKQILKAVTVAGRHASPGVVAKLTGLDRPGLARASSALYNSGLLVDDGDRIGFRHDLIRGYLYRSMGQLTRSSLHAMMAEELEGRADVEPATLARHFAAADRSTEAFEYGVAAARDAEDRAAHREAVQLIRLAASYAGSPGEEARALSIEARALFALGRLAGASEAAEAALTTDELDGEAHMGLALIYSDALIEQGEWKRAREMLHSVEEQARAPEDRLSPGVAWAKYLLFRAAVHANDREAAAGVLETFPSAGTSGSDGAVPAAVALRTLCWAAFQMFYGAVDEAEAVVSSLDFSVEDLPYDLRRRVYSLQSTVLFRLGKFPESRAVLQQLGVQAHERNDLRTVALCYGNLSAIEAVEGNFERAIEMIRHALSEYGTSRRATVHEATLRLTEADGFFHQEEFSRAKEGYRRALNLAEEGQLKALIPQLYAAYGLSALPLGDTGEAIAAREKMESVSGPLGGVQNRYRIYWLEAALMEIEGSGDPAAYLSDKAAEEASSDVPSARCLRWLAQLYGGDGPVSHGERLADSEAIEPLRELGMSWFAYQSRRWLQRVKAKAVGADPGREARN